MKMTSKWILTVLFVMGFTLSSIAQQGKGNRMGMRNPDNQAGMHQSCQNIPDLTEEQEEKILDLKTEHLKKRTEHRNQIQTKRAEMRSLTTGDNVDMPKAEALADEIASLKASMMKESLSHRNEIRELLTEKQKVYFDAKRGKKQHMRKRPCSHRKSRK
ncbi:MAG: Spy/CpxP family protein refolding chaperone [Bacteroidales bacterium]